MEFNRDDLSKELLKSFEEKFEFDDQEEQKPNSVIKILFILIVSAGVGFGIYALNTDKIAISREGEEVPIIKADNNPVRFKPIEPGGMTIDNRDKKIYKAIAGDNETEELPKVVQLLPTAEEPMSRQTIKNSEANFAGIFDGVKNDIVKNDEIVKNDNSVKDDIVKNTETKSVQNEPKEVVIIESPSQNIAVANNIDLKNNEVKVDQVENIKTASKPEPVLEPEQEPITVDDIKNVPSDENSKRVVEPKKLETGYKLQLGSYRSENDVKDSWNKILKLHSQLLADINLITEKADVADKGIFYRLQVGYFSSEEKARKICKELIEQKQGCFIVKK